MKNSENCMASKMRPPMLVLFSACLFALLLQIASASNGPPSLYKCVDWDCEEWISKGKTLLLYMGRTDKHLSFKKNQDIIIIGKPVDESSPDWIGKIGNKIGLVPRDYIREDKMNKNKGPPKFTVGLHEISAWSRNDEEQVKQVDDDADDEAEEEDENDDIGLQTPVTVELLPSATGTVDSPKDIEAPSNDVPQEKVEEGSLNQSFSTPTPEFESTDSLTLDTDTVESPKDAETQSNDVPQEEMEEGSLDQSITTPTSESESTDSLPSDTVESPKDAETQSNDALQEEMEEGSLDQSISTPTPGSESTDSLPSDTVESPKDAETQSNDVPQKEMEEGFLDQLISTLTPTPESKSTDSLPLDTDTVESPKDVETQSNDVPQEKVEEGSLDQSISTPTPTPESESTDSLPSDTDTVESPKDAETQSNDVPQEEMEEGSLDQSISTPTPESESTDSLPLDTVESPKDAETQSNDVPQEMEEGSLDQSISTPTPESESTDSLPLDTDTVESPKDVETQSNDVSQEKVEEESLDQLISTPTPTPESESTDSLPSDTDTVESPKDVETQSNDVPHEMEEGSLDQSISTPTPTPESESTDSLPSDIVESPKYVETQSNDVPQEEMEEGSLDQSSSTPTPESESTDSLPSDTDAVETPTQSNGVPQEKVEDDDHSHSHDTTQNDAHDDHQHHHHHHHRHNLFKDSNDTETSSLILVIKHISSTLLSFLPEPLQDTILDVDDALVLTGIIALTLVSICVPYFLIEAHMSLRPLKKKVVELNKSLWKVSAAYETQQEEFEIFKQKAIAHDEFKKRAEQSENDVVILKKLDTKHREQITALKNQLKSQMKEAVDIRALIEKTLEAKKVVAEECEKYKAAYESTKVTLHSAKDELNSIQTQAKSSALLLNVSGRNVEVLNSKISMLEQEAEEIKTQLVAENEKRKAVEKEKHEVEQSKAATEKELTDFKNICHQYEESVSSLNDEISKLESELTTIKETLGDDSPLLEVAEIQAKAAFSEKEAESLRTRLNGLSADNENLSGKVKEMSSALEDAHCEREKTDNRLQVLEKYFKEREEEYIKTIEQLQLKESVRDKGKEELIKIIEEKDNVCKDLDDRLEALKEEFEETKQQHRNEIRTLEAKGHENWLSLCQAERKAQDARKEAQQLRQRLTALSKEKDDDEDGDGLNGEVPMFPVLPDELVPLPIFDEPPSYFDLGDDFVPPPPLPEGGEIEPHRPPPLGGRLSPSFSDYNDNVLSPIGVGRRDEDCTDGSSGSNSPRRSPPLRGGWVNVPHDHEGQTRDNIRGLSRATSSPVQRGVNL